MISTSPRRWFYHWFYRQKAAVKKRAGIRLDIGCGGAKQDGFVGMDIRALPGVDIVWNVEEYPWPLDDESVIQAMSSHLVEHLNPHNFGFINFMDEAWRVMKPDCQFLVICPHGRSSGFLQDPTHINALNEVTWRYFDPDAGGLWEIYKPKPWAIRHLEWNPDGNMEVILVKRRNDYSE